MAALSSSSRRRRRRRFVINILTVLIGIIASLIGIFLYTTIPTKLGLYSWLANRNPHLVGFTPATLYGVPRKYTFDELYSSGSNNLNGQYAIVTGASSGIGYAMSRVLVRLGAHVTMGCRNPTKCQAKANEIRQQLWDDDIDDIKLRTMTIDTSSFKSVKQFADKYIATIMPPTNTSSSSSLDMLFLNAGTAYHTDKTHPCVPLSDEDGIEYVFQTNYLGHHLLYRLLEPLLLSSSSTSSSSSVATVVQTSSLASFDSYPSYRVATDLETLNGCHWNGTRTAGKLSYGQSKLAQILWVKELTKRLKGGGEGQQPNNSGSAGAGSSNIIANAFNPGFVATEIFDKLDMPKWMRIITNYFVQNAAWTPMDGALTGLFLGIEKERLVRDNIRGKYFHPIVNEIPNHPLAGDDDDTEVLQKKLWEFSDSLIKDYIM